MQEHWNKSQELIKQLGALVSDNPSEEQRMVALNGLQNQWLEAASGADSNSADAVKRELLRRASRDREQIIVEFDAVSAAERSLRVDQGRAAEFTLSRRDVGNPDRRADPGDRADIRGVERNPDARAIPSPRALKSAEEANQAKTNFLAVVSHELRNPLNSILLWCNALMTSGTLERQSRSRRQRNRPRRQGPGPAHRGSVGHLEDRKRADALRRAADQSRRRSCTRRLTA